MGTMAKIGFKGLKAEELNSKPPTEPAASAKATLGVGRRSDQSGECHLVIDSSEFQVDYFRNVEGRESDDCISGFQLVGQGVIRPHQVYGFGLSPGWNTQADFYARDRYILLTHEPSRSILEAHIGQ
jgi:hypothetical protein